jgi:hypothetical protein
MDTIMDEVTPVVRFDAYFSIDENDKPWGYQFDLKVSTTDGKFDPDGEVLTEIDSRCRDFDTDQSTKEFIQGLSDCILHSAIVYCRPDLLKLNNEELVKAFEKIEKCFEELAEKLPQDDSIFKIFWNTKDCIDQLKLQLKGL